jgi:hypothetical protein
MKTPCKFIIRTFNQLVGGSICAGAVLLIAFGAQAQKLFARQQSYTNTMEPSRLNVGPVLLPA